MCACVKERRTSKGVDNLMGRHVDVEHNMRVACGGLGTLANKRLLKEPICRAQWPTSPPSLPVESMLDAKLLVLA